MRDARKTSREREAFDKIRDGRGLELLECAVRDIPTENWIWGETYTPPDQSGSSRQGRSLHRPIARRG
jgi:hypothetical protein